MVKPSRSNVASQTLVARFQRTSFGNQPHQKRALSSFAAYPFPLITDKSRMVGRVTPCAPSTVNERCLIRHDGAHTATRLSQPQTIPPIINKTWYHSVHSVILSKNVPTNLTFQNLCYITRLKFTW